MNATPKTAPCFHCNKETPANQRRCVHCGKQVGTAADIAVVLFLIFGVPLGLVFTLGAQGAAARTLGALVLAFSLGASLWGGGAIWRGERKAGRNRGGG